MNWQKWQQIPREIRKIILVVITVLIVGCIWGVWRATRKVINENSMIGYLTNLEDHSMIETNINDKKFTLELVNTSGSIQQGLSDRAEIGSDGMLFVLGPKGYYPFWMPRMSFDLDIIWLDEGEIVDIAADVPAEPGVPMSQLAIYTSARPANMALEIPAGRAKLLGIAIGDHLEIAR